MADKTNEAEHEKEQLLESETSNVSKTSKVDKIKGMSAAFLMTVGVGVSGTCVQLLQRKIPDFELNAMRFSLPSVVFAVVLAVMRQTPKIPKSEILNFFGFGLICFLESCTFYIVVTLIPMSYFKSLVFTCTLLSGFILFPIFLGERTRLDKVLLAVVSMIGVVLSIQPEFIFTGKKHHYVATLNPTINSSDVNFTNSERNISLSDTKPYSVSTMLTILGCALSAVDGVLITSSVIYSHLKPSLNQNMFGYFFWFSGFSTVVSLILMAIFEKPVNAFSLTLVEFGLVIGHTIAYLIVWPAFLYSAKYISGNANNIINSSIVVIMLIPQYTVLSHIMPGNKNWIEVTGTVLVFLGAAGSSVLEIIQENV